MNECVCEVAGLGDGDPSVTNLEMQPEPGSPGHRAAVTMGCSSRAGSLVTAGDTDTGSLEISKARGNKTSSKM